MTSSGSVAAVLDRLRALAEPDRRADPALEDVLAGAALHLATAEPDPASLTSRQLARALAAACAATGRGALAQDILERHGGLPDGRAALFCRALLDASAGGARHDLLRKGWLEPRTDPTHPPGASWRLDAGALAAALNLRTEIECFRALDRVAEEVAPLWADSDGAGRLGLKGLNSLADTWGVRPARRPALLAELRDRLADRLARVARAHVWSRAPDVIIEELCA